MKIRRHDWSTQQEKTFKVFLFVGMCVAFFLFHIWFRTVVVTRGYEVAELRRSIARLESESVVLKVTKNRLKNAGNLEKLADDMAAKGNTFKSPEAKQLFYAPPSGR